jgi:hypothetical protein
MRLFDETNVTVTAPESCLPLLGRYRFPVRALEENTLLGLLRGM